jgi:hypothetical protein
MKLPRSVLVPLSVGFLACSDPPPQPAAIGIQVALQTPLAQDNPQGRQCQVQPNGSRSYQVGKPDGNSTVENGKSGVEVSCTVRESGEVKIDLFAANQAVGLPGNFNFNLSANVSSLTDATQNTGALGFFDPDAGRMRTPVSPLCTLSPPMSQSQITRKAGAMIAAFTCPLLESPDAPGEGCRASGTFAVEYCKTGEEDE